MSFEQQERIIAVSPDAVDTLLVGLSNQYAESLADAGKAVITIGAYWDDENKTRLRPASIDGTITGSPLKDGRIAFRCLWQSNLAAAFDRGEIPQAQQLSESEFSDLKPEIPRN